jgi:hypothetical protein
MAAVTEHALVRLPKILLENRPGRRMVAFVIPAMSGVRGLIGYVDFMYGTAVDFTSHCSYSTVA